MKHTLDHTAICNLSAQQAGMKSARLRTRKEVAARNLRYTAARARCTAAFAQQACRSQFASAVQSNTMSKKSRQLVTHLRQERILQHRQRQRLRNQRDKRLHHAMHVAASAKEPAECNSAPVTMPLRNMLHRAVEERVDSIRALTRSLPSCSRNASESVGFEAKPRFTSNC